MGGPKISITGLSKRQLEGRFHLSTTNAKLVSPHHVAFGVWPTLEEVQ